MTEQTANAVLDAARSEMSTGASPAEVRNALIRHMGHIASERDIRAAIAAAFEGR
ncbi:MAG: hypothetical protein AAF919_05530 [Pseudomonadota bacterium]